MQLLANINIYFSGTVENKETVSSSSPLLFFDQLQKPQPAYLKMPSHLNPLSTSTSEYMEEHISMSSSLMPSRTHRCPNIKVDFVSASLKIEGEQHITMVVLQLPPRES